MNGWIFVELLIVSFFLATVIDPIYDITSNLLRPSGFEMDHRYVANIKIIPKGSADFLEEEAGDSIHTAHFRHIVRMLRDLAEVESFCYAMQMSVPSGNSWWGGQAMRDSSGFSQKDYEKLPGYVHFQQFSFCKADGSDLFHVYGMTDAIHGGALQIADDPKGNKLYLSAYCARRLFGDKNPIGQTFYTGVGDGHEVAGVYDDVKYTESWQPYPMVTWVNAELEPSSWVSFFYPVVLRLKEGVNEEAFLRRFKAEVAPTLKVGNLYCDGLTSFRELNAKRMARMGVTNKLRLQYALGGFALLCIFLGMVGTFWIRSQARRQEIGVMRSMGASQGRICRQFLSESWLLLTIAFVLTIPLLWHYFQLEGFYQVQQSGQMVPNPAYWQNQPGTRFVILMLLDYLLLLLISLTGTYIPTRRAARVLPCEALREE